MAKIITMYNNKGGVSKTTTLYNLAAFLSMEGKKILLADCDPQCNATELFFSSSEVLDDPDVELDGTSIYQALYPRFSGDVGTIDSSTVDLVQSELYENLYILRGDLEFVKGEASLSVAWNQAITEEVHYKRTYVSMYKLLTELGESHGFDYVLCDVGPSTGAITRMVVLASDGFLLPVTPDRFCSQAVKLLGEVISQWIKRHAEISNTFEPFGISTFPGKPVLLGTIVQNFKVHYSRGRGAKVKRSYEKWQERIASNINEFLLSSDGIEAGERFTQDTPFTANIIDVDALAPLSQIFGCAIFDIKQEYTREASSSGDMFYGSVWDPWVAKMETYKSEIRKIAEVLP